MFNKTTLASLLLLLSTQIMSATFVGEITEAQECSGFSRCDIKRVSDATPCTLDFKAKYKDIGVRDQTNRRGQHQWSLSGPELSKNSITVNGTKVKLKNQKRPYMLRGNNIAYSLEGQNYTVSVLFEYEAGEEVMPIEYLLSRKSENGEKSIVYKCVLN